MASFELLPCKSLIAPGRDVVSILSIINDPWSALIRLIHGTGKNPEHLAIMVPKKNFSSYIIDCKENA